MSVLVVLCLFVFPVLLWIWEKFDYIFLYCYLVVFLIGSDRDSLIYGLSNYYMELLF